MHDAEYIEALILAAKHGQSGMIKIRLELCPECHGIKLRGSFITTSDRYFSERIIGWEQFRGSRFPITLLQTAIDSLRAQIVDAAK